MKNASWLSALRVRFLRFLFGLPLHGVVEIERGSCLILEATDGRRIPNEALDRIQALAVRVGVNAVVLDGSLRLRAVVRPEQVQLIIDDPLFRTIAEGTSDRTESGVSNEGGAV